MYHRSRLTPGGAWGDWSSFSGAGNIPVHSTAAVAANADNRLEVFALTANTHRWQITPAGGWANPSGPWGAWAPV
jgi:hypothetical protein